MGDSRAAVIPGIGLHQQLKCASETTGRTQRLLCHAWLSPSSCSHACLTCQQHHLQRLRGQAICSQQQGEPRTAARRDDNAPALRDSWGSRSGQPQGGVHVRVHSDRRPSATKRSTGRKAWRVAPWGPCLTSRGGIARRPAANSKVSHERHRSATTTHRAGGTAGEAGPGCLKAGCTCLCTPTGGLSSAGCTFPRCNGLATPGWFTPWLHERNAHGRSGRAVRNVD